MKKKQKKKKDNNSKKNIMIIGLIILVLALIAGGTFAYWTWVTNTAQQTAVTFTIQGAGGEGPLDTEIFDATFEGSGTLSATNLEPLATCNGTQCIKETVKVSYVNKTPYAATLSLQLKLTGFTVVSGRNTFNNSTTTSTLDNIQDLKWRITTASADANDATANSLDFTVNTSFGTASGGTDSSFKGLTFSSATAFTPALPITLATLNLSIPANTNITTKTYYLYLWLDDNYKHQNVGNVNSDPAQGLNIKLEWGDGVMSHVIPE